MDIRTISVLGCGWLGLPLAGALVRAGYAVRGSTTTPDKLAEIEAAGARPHRLVVGEEVDGDEVGAFFGSEVLVFAVPPSASAVPYSDVARAVRHAAERHGTGWVLMTSSTSVYPDLDGVVDEADAGAEEGLPLGRRGEEVLAAERVFYACERCDTTVLRLAGLYGYGRHPARTLAGQTDIAGGEAPVNLVHRDDVIGAVEVVLAQEARGRTFNVCADAHPTRRRLYPAVAERLGLEPPVFTDGAAGGYKIVSNRRLKDELGYVFRHPDPMVEAP